MIRILQCVNDMHRAGLETMLMNYYRHIDREKIQFDFLTHRPQKSDYDDEIKSLGGRVYYAPRLYPQNYPAYFSYMRNFFLEHPEYKIVHSHIDAMSYLPLRAAQKAKIPVRIAHSHNTSIDRDYKFLLKMYYRKRLPSAANCFVACGQAAGRFLFGNRNFTVIPNAVDAKKFVFDEGVRARKRRELGYKNEFVIGHVGRISYQKNHQFLIRIFYEIQKKCAEAVLMLVGVGEKEQEVRQQVAQLGLNEKVRFLGNRDDVNELYQAMDAFVLPSLFEGIPVVGIEAQFADLPCFFSTAVPDEVKFNPKTQFIDLNKSVSVWADAILRAIGLARRNDSSYIHNSHYDISTAHQILEKYYFSFFLNGSNKGN